VAGVWPLRIPEIEGSLAVSEHHSKDEFDDPLLDPWPFLLIVRTGHTVTALR
jgi:hypothetical protein